ncbi:MAG: HepT-like ribonuclease domain-containing protein [Campylobacterota bacterium]|nr:HepT-like ribonuclease domain-containing protein [Campylobacterota bacterium]
MYRSENRIKSIIKKIKLIETIIEEFDGKISKALEDETKSRPAILMHLVSIAEQINKLKDESAFEILEKFSKEDLKGLYDVRNFIAHDYDGIDLSVIEDVIRYGIPSLKNSIDTIEI